MTESNRWQVPSPLAAQLWHVSPEWRVVDHKVRTDSLPSNRSLYDDTITFAPSIAHQVHPDDKTWQITVLFQQADFLLPPDFIWPPPGVPPSDGAKFAVNEALSHWRLSEPKCLRQLLDATRYGRPPLAATLQQEQPAKTLLATISSSRRQQEEEQARQTAHIPAVKEGSAARASATLSERGEEKRLERTTSGQGAKRQGSTSAAAATAATQEAPPKKSMQPLNWQLKVSMENVRAQSSAAASGAGVSSSSSSAPPAAGAAPSESKPAAAAAAAASGAAPVADDAATSASPDVIEVNDVATEVEEASEAPGTGNASPAAPTGACAAAMDVDAGTAEGVGGAPTGSVGGAAKKTTAIVAAKPEPSPLRRMAEKAQSLFSPLSAALPQPRKRLRRLDGISAGEEGDNNG